MAQLVGEAASKGRCKRRIRADPGLVELDVEADESFGVVLPKPGRCGKIHRAHARGGARVQRDVHLRGGAVPVSASRIHRHCPCGIQPVGFHLIRGEVHAPVVEHRAGRRSISEEQRRYCGETVSARTRQVQGDCSAFSFPGLATGADHISSPQNSTESTRRHDRSDFSPGLIGHVGRW